MEEGGWLARLEGRAGGGIMQRRGGMNRGQAARRTSKRVADQGNEMGEFSAGKRGTGKDGVNESAAHAAPVQAGVQAPGCSSKVWSCCQSTCVWAATSAAAASQLAHGAELLPRRLAEAGHGGVPLAHARQLRLVALQSGGGPPAGVNMCPCVLPLLNAQSGPKQARGRRWRLPSLAPHCCACRSCLPSPAQASREGNQLGRLGWRSGPPA